ncbi:MAG: 2-C-methyl-D-erythritol 4-phosphate cytidylyltransferase [Bacteroidota bacterium]
MKKYAVIVAGGSGLRMGTQVPKQFLLLGGKPVLWHTLTVFLEAYEDLDIILVLPEEHLETGKAILYSTQAPQRIRMVTGGTTRFQSVKNGLRYVEEESVIFVQDGVRCLLTTSLIHRCYDKAVEYGAAIPVIDSKDSVRLVTPEGNVAMDRSRVKLVQTPQTFLSGILLPSFRVEYQELFTDEASVVEASGHKVHLVEGEPHNIKITTPEDLVLAEQLLILFSKE